MRNSGIRLCLEPEEWGKNLQPHPVQQVHDDCHIKAVAHFAQAV